MQACMLVVTFKYWIICLVQVNRYSVARPFGEPA